MGNVGKGVRAVEFQGKSQRLRERLKLTIPVRVQGRESPSDEWAEMTRLIDVTPFGAAFVLGRPTEPGRMLHLTMALPRQLRCFDHTEDQYRVWSVVRRVESAAVGTADEGQQGGQVKLEVGVAFSGKHPPASYLKNPKTRYEVMGGVGSEGLLKVREPATDEQGRPQRSQDTRLPMPINVVLEVLDNCGQVRGTEWAVTENISRRGAAVWSSLGVERGGFVRMTSTEQGISVMAAVRARRVGVDGIPRLHVEFVDRQWPLEGIE